MGVEGFFARRGLYARGTAIRQELPALLVILEIGDHNLAENLFVHGGIENRTQDLDPAVEIAWHHVGGRNINRGLRMRQRMAGPETVDAAMLQETSDDRFDADIFGQPRHARPQTADAAHDQVNCDARGRSVVKRIDDSRINQRIHLHPDRRRPTGLCVRDLLRDVVEDALAEVDRRNRHAFKFGRLSVAGDVIEDARNIAADDRIGGKE